MMDFAQANVLFFPPLRDDLVCVNACVRVCECLGDAFQVENFEIMFTLTLLLLHFPPPVVEKISCDPNGVLFFARYD